MKDRMKALVIPTLLVLTTFFSYGCTATQRKELLDEVKMYAADEIKNAVPKLAAVLDAKIAEAKKKKLAELDASLAQLKMNDPETNEPIPDTVKTWKSFDVNNDGDLDEIEAAKAGAWIVKTLAERVATGKMSKEQAGTIGKSAGATIIALMLYGLGKRGTSAVVKKFGKNGNGNGKPDPGGGGGGAVPAALAAAVPGGAPGAAE